MKISPVQSKKSNGTKRQTTETESFPQMQISRPHDPMTKGLGRHLGLLCAWPYFVFLNKMRDFIHAVVLLTLGDPFTPVIIGLPVPFGGRTASIT